MECNGKLNFFEVFCQIACKEPRNNLMTALQQSKGNSSGFALSAIIKTTALWPKSILLCINEQYYLYGRVHYQWIQLKLNINKKKIDCEYKKKLGESMHQRLLTSDF